MDPLDEKLKQRAKEEPFPLPEEFSQRLEALCRELEAQPVRKKRVFHPLRWTAGAAAALILLLPNVSVSAQAAMEQIPVLGSIVRVVTLRNYFYDDGHSFASVSIPSVSQGGPGGDAVNEAVQEYTDRLLTQFQQDIQDTGEGYQGLDVSYEVTCDTDTWFTLRINALQVQASGHEMVRYYHIDKTTGQMVTLSDLFPQGTDYVTPLSQEVLRQAVDPANERQAKPIPDSVYLMNHITCPAILVECGFLSNPEEEGKLRTEGYQLQLAAALTGAWLQYEEQFNP